MKKIKKQMILCLTALLCINISACGTGESSEAVSIAEESTAKESSAAVSTAEESSAVESSAVESSAEEGSSIASTAEKSSAEESTEEESTVEESAEEESSEEKDSAEEVSSADESNPEKADYTEALFDTSYLHEINVEIDEDDWEDLLANALDKPKYNVTVTVDGECYDDVSFSPKGNASLFMVAETHGSRYSFKLKFNKKDKEQTYHGLREFVLNNSWGDNSYLRDYAAALTFQNEGISTAAMSFTKLSINGEYYGLYMAAETIDQEYLDRCFSGEGVIYKPESEVLLARDQKQIDAIRDYIASGSEEAFSRRLESLDPDYSTSGADLKYTDDKEESYSDIFDNEITDTTQEDHEEVIAALKSLSEGDIEEAIDAEEVMRYFAVQNFVGNGDSYTNVMLHNYILYENNGILSMIPWDYNGSADLKAMWPVTGCGEEYTIDDLINQGLDTPTFGEVKLENRPMLNWIYQDEESYEKYQEIITEEVSAYAASEEFTEEMQRIYDQIKPWVESDPTAFCTAEEFEEGYRDLMDFYRKRAESLQKQAAGELSKETAEQKDEDRVK